MIPSEDHARQFVEARCERQAMDRLIQFASMLAEENTHQNLVSRASLAHVWSRHIADAAQLLDHVPRETSTWLDLGTGAGFPGLVVAAMRPEMLVFLVESRRKRIDWLDACRVSLNLDSVKVIGKRLETVEAFPVDAISARAFAPLPKLVTLAIPFSTKATVWVLPKGRSAAQEVADMPKKLGKLFHVEQSWTDPEGGIVVGSGLEASKQ